MKHSNLSKIAILLASACTSSGKNMEAAGGKTTGSASGGSTVPSGTGGQPGAGGTGSPSGANGGSSGAAGGAAGTGGRAGTGGAMAGGGMGMGGMTAGTGGVAMIANTGQSVFERNKNPARDGHYIQPTLTQANAAKISLDAAFTGAYPEGTWNNPLFMEDGPGHKGAFFVATLGNDVIALSETNGAMVWTKNMGVVAQGAPCGGPYKSVGIFGTPVIDPASRTLFVVNAVGPQGITGFKVHALSVDDGQEMPGWPIDVGSVIKNFAPAKHNQRGALSLVKGILYIPFGGHWGDCGPYQGRILAIDIKDPTKTGNWATTGERAAIWAAGGMASDGDGVFATTGDGARNPPASHQPGGITDSNAVLRATGLAVVDRSVNNYYYPSRWTDMDINDNDFGSNNPIFIQVPGATQKGFVVALSKDGHMVFLDSQKLGGMDGHILDLMVARKGMSIHTAPASYRTTKGVYVTLGTDGGASCPALGGQVIMGVSIPVTAGAIKPVVAWCVPQTGAVTSPIATTTDGTGESIVWFMSGGKLMGVDGDTGKTVAAPTGTCAGVLRWTSPIAVKGRIVTGGGAKLCSWSVP